MVLRLDWKTDESGFDARQGKHFPATVLLFLGSCSMSNEPLKVADVSGGLIASFFEAVIDVNVRHYFWRYCTQYMILKDFPEMWLTVSVLVTIGLRLATTTSYEDLCAFPDVC
jgi:hypothetical protein